MIKLTDIQNFPDGTPIDAVQGRITEVYPLEKKVGTKGPYTLQKAYISDVGGNKIKLTVWDHPDLSPLKGNEYVLHNTGGTRYPGIKVRLGSYVAQKDGKQNKAGDTVKTLELNVTKNGCFQHVEVFNQSKPAGAAPAEPVSRPAEASEGPKHPDPRMAATPAYINGASVGMAVNNAVQILIANGKVDLNDLKFKVWGIASDILEVSQKLEKGNLAGQDKTVGKVEQAKPVTVATPVEEPLEDQVPF